MLTMYSFVNKLFAVTVDNTMYSKNSTGYRQFHSQLPISFFKSTQLA